MEPEITRWAIVLLGAMSISVGLGTRFARTAEAKDWCAVIAFVAAGTGLIVSQTG